MLSMNSFAQLFPYCIKPIYGLVSDVFPIASQRRRPYLILGLLGSVLTFAAFPYARSRSAFTWIVFFNNVFKALTLTQGEALVIDYSLEYKLSSSEVGSLLSMVTAPTSPIPGEAAFPMLAPMLPCNRCP